MAQALEKLLAERILLLDGAMGTMIQRVQLVEEHYICHKATCVPPLAAASLNQCDEKHRSPIRKTPQPLAFRGTDAKELPS